MLFPPFLRIVPVFICHCPCTVSGARLTGEVKEIKKKMKKMDRNAGSGELGSLVGKTQHPSGSACLLYTVDQEQQSYGIQMAKEVGLLQINMKALLWCRSRRQA